MRLRKILSIILCTCLILTAIPLQGISAANVDLAETEANVEIAETGADVYGLVNNVQYGQILQCWNWSFNNIKELMPKIAAQGFSAIQTSPIQATKESTREYYSTVWNSSWVFYQPVAFNIEDNSRNVLGTKSDFEAMCQEAHKYGVKVIVDTIFNHMANDMSGNTIHPWIPSEIKDNSDCWHDVSKNIYDFENRYDSTHYCLTGLPDLNTANSTVQKHCTNFLKECIDAGADGFRFDAAKHIETDWDASGTKSDFWPNVLNAATSYAQETRGMTPFYYGEILGSPGGGLSIEAYTRYMSVTDTGANDVRQAVIDGNASRAASSSIGCGAAPDKAVQWTESHDTFKDNGTRFVSDHNINKTWAIVGARNQVCGMYLARPENIDTTMLGDADVTSWSYPEVKAVNKFKNYFAGQAEYMSSYGSVAYIERGTSGVVLVNTGGTYYNNVSVPAHIIESGTYKDAITGNTFTVSGGNITGDIGDTGIAVVYDIDSSGELTPGAPTGFALTGTFNNWNTTANVMTAEDNNWATTSVVLDAGTYTFKIKADDLWFSNTGTISDTTGDSGWTMNPGVDDNCTLVATGGRYTFRFNTVTQKLVVEHSEDTSSDIFLKGTFNDWDGSNEMTYVSGENKVTTSITLDAGTYTFKIHNHGIGLWYGNTGTINDTTGDSGWTMGAGKDKCTLVATGGEYEFTYDLSTNKLTVLFESSGDTETTATTSPVETTAPEETTAPDTNTVTISMFSDNSSTDWILNNTDRQFFLIDNDTAVSYPMTMGEDSWTVTVPSEVNNVTFTREKSGTVSHTIYAGERGEDINFYIISNDAGYWESAKPENGYSAYSLVGSFNDWKEVNVMKNTADGDTVTETLKLEAGTYTFRFKKGSTYYGNSGTVNDSTGGNTWSTKTTSGSTYDITLVATGGTYTFSFINSTKRFMIEYTADTPDVPDIPDDPEEEIDPLLSEFYLRGDFNDWTSETPMTFVTEGSTVVAAVLELEAGDYAFKIQDKGNSLWYGNTGTINDSTDGNSWSMHTDAGDCTLSATGGTYTFQFDTSTKRLTVFYATEGEDPDNPENPELQEFTVTFKDYDGTVLDEQTVIEGESAVLPSEEPSREADEQYTYTFSGWDTPYTNIKADTVITATYEAKLKEYTVTFVDHDGTALSTQTVKYGESAEAPTTPERESSAQFDYAFSKWDADFSSVKSDMIIQAVYTETLREYTVTFLGMNDKVLDTQKVKYGSGATAPEIPEVEGYEFVSWDRGFTSIVSDTTVKAIYRALTVDTVNTYLVVFKDEDGKFIAFENVTEGESATAPAAPEKAADAQYTYVFSGWDKDFSAVTEDMVVTAMYDKVVNKYTVTFLDKDGNEIDKVEVEYGATAVAPAAPAVDGYTFKGWDSDITNVTNDMTVKAQYSKVVEAATTGKLSVEVSGGAGFTISVAGGAARPQGTSYYNTKMPMNTSVTLVANAAEGMEFLGWVNANMVVLSTEETYTFITTGNDFAKAVYRTDLDGASLVIFKNDKAAGGNGAILDLQYYVAGEEIVIPANPAQAGYDFAGWDMTSDQIAAKVRAGENVTVLATWTVAEVFVNVTVNGGTFVASKVNADGKIYANYAVTATANAAEEGKKFAYWADAETGEVLSYNAEYKFYPGKDTEITAIYVATDATVDYKVLVGMSADPNAEPTKIRYYVTYYVPEAELGYEFVSAGVIIVDEANYKEDMFYHGSGLSGMTDTAPGSIQVATGNQPGAAVTKSNCFSGNTYYAKTWVIYKDAQGVEQIAYSDLLVIDKL